LLEKNKPCTVPIFEVITQRNGTFLCQKGETMQETKELTTEEKARLMRNKYARDWRRKNPEKVKEALQRHYAKKYDLLMKEAEENEVQDGDKKSV
jgi:hypothetical protein